MQCLLELIGTMDPVLVEELRSVQQRKDIIEDIEEFIMHAMEVGAISGNNAGAILHPLHHELSECIHNVEKLRQGHLNALTEDGDHRDRSPKGANMGGAVSALEAKHSQREAKKLAEEQDDVLKQLEAELQRKRNTSEDTSTPRKTPSAPQTKSTAASGDEAAGYNAAGKATTSLASGEASAAGAVTALEPFAAAPSPSSNTGLGSTGSTQAPPTTDTEASRANFAQSNFGTLFLEENSAEEQSNLLGPDDLDQRRGSMFSTVASDLTSSPKKVLKKKKKMIRPKTNLTNEDDLPEVIGIPELDQVFPPPNQV